VKLCIFNGTVVSDTIFSPGAVCIEDGVISFLGPSEELPPLDGQWEKVNANGSWIAPGLIDVHIHGCAGEDFMEGGSHALQTMAEHVAGSGVTGFLPSTVTASRAKTRRAAETVASYNSDRGAEVLGIHLEGPYLNEQKKGAQLGEEIRRADLEELDQLYSILGERLQLVTIAPEVPGSFAAVQWLIERGITVSAGHTDASYEDAMEGFRRGISHVAHTYNGMRGLHHRDPGVVGAAFAAPHVFSEIIADGIHVHPGAMEALVKAKGVDWMILVTDAVQAAGLPDGEYILGDQVIYVQDGAARLEAGNLAGSTLSLMDAVKNMVEFGIASFKDALQMASLNPARSLGLRRRGWLRETYQGDVVLISPSFVVEKTFVAGRLAYQREG